MKNTNITIIKAKKKVDSFLAMKVFILSLFVLLLFYTDAAMAQAWASKTEGFLDTIIAGLKLLGRAVATVTILWAALMLFTGTKSFRDLIPWVVAACIFGAVTEIVAIFFT